MVSQIAFQDDDRRHLVDHAPSLRTRNIGLEESLLGVTRGEALVPSLHRKRHPRLGQGIDQTRAEAFDALRLWPHLPFRVEGNADDHSPHLQLATIREDRRY